MSDPNLPPIGPPPSRYDALNTQLNGLPDLLVKVAQSPTYQKMQAQRQSAASGGGMWDRLGQPAQPPEDQLTEAARNLPSMIGGGGGNPNWQPSKPTALSAGLSGATNSMSFGGYDALIKRLAPLAYAKEQQLKQQYPGAEMAGEVGGALVPTPGNLIGAGIKGAGLGANLLRAGTQAAAQAIPRGIVTAADTGNIGQAATEAGIGMGAGTIFGLAGNKLGQLFAGGKLADRLGEMNDEQIVGALGGTQRMMKSISSFGLAPNQYMAMSNAARGIKSDAADLVAKNGLNTISKIRTWFQDNITRPYNSMSKAYADAGIKLEPGISEIQQLPGVQALQQGNPELMDGLMQQIQKADRQSTAFAVKKSLGSFAGKIGKSSEYGADDIDMARDAVTDISHYVDEQAAQAAVSSGALKDIDVEKLRQTYPAAKLLSQIVRAHDLGVARVNPNSATFARLATEGLLGGSIGAILPEDQNASPGQRMMNAGIGLAAGTLGGEMLNQGLSRSANAGLVRLASGVRLAVPKIASAISKTATASGPKLAALGGAAPSIFAQNQDSSIGQAPQTGIPTGTSSGAVDTPETQQTLASIQQKEAALPSEHKQNIVDTMNAQFNTRIQSKLQQDYATYWKYTPQYSGMDQNAGYQKFLNDVQQQYGNGRGGFDPKQAAGILYEDPKQRTDYLRQYDAALTLRNINLNAALLTPMEQFKAKLGGAVTTMGAGSAADINRSTDAIKQLMVSSARMNDPSLSPQMAEKQASDDLLNIQRMPGDQQSKYQLLIQTLNSKYKLSLPMLQDVAE